MVLVRRRSPANVATLAWILLVALLSCIAASTRLPLKSKNDLEDNSASRLDENMRIATLAEDSLLDDSAARSRSQTSQDLDGPRLSIPEFMDRMLTSAFSSVDRVSSGLLSGLAGPNIDFAKTKDGERLIARLHLPSAGMNGGKEVVSPKLSVAVLGRSHLRVKLDMRGERIQTSSEHTYGLPAYVSGDDVKVTPQEDGTVHVSLRILKDTDIINESAVESEGGTGNHAIDSLLTRRLRNPIFDVLAQRDSLTNNGAEQEIIEELPRPEDVAHCRSKHPNEKIVRKKCMCDETPSKSGKAVCYGSLISKAVHVARRLGMQDFATNAKHHAIECADFQVNTVECLEKVSSQLLHSLYKEGPAMRGGRLEDRVRAAIESEDDGPSKFDPSYGAILIVLTIVALVGLFAGCAMLYGVRRYGGNMHSNRILSQLSSVLTQTSRPNTASDATAGQGSRVGGLQGIAKHPNSRVNRKPGTKPSSAESKIA